MNPTKHRARVIACVFLASILSRSLVYAQEDAKPGQVISSQSAKEPLRDRQDVPTLHTGTHLVLLDVAVTDKKGHTVPGLKKDDFKIFEDRQQQTVKFFEEHKPLDPALIAKNKDALAASLPVNTFTNSEPFAEDSVIILLLDELIPLPDYDLASLQERMLEVIRTARPGTMFAVYALNSKLTLVQSLTGDHGLLFGAINQAWLSPHFGTSLRDFGQPEKSERALSAGYASPALVDARRRVFTDAMKQLTGDLKSISGRKTIFTFTGGLRCTLSSNLSCVAPGHPLFLQELTDYLCGVEASVEQGRISTYRYYPHGQILYGFGCSNSQISLSEALDTDSYYYTNYYTPTNEDWNGAYRKFKVTLASADLRPTYRSGYFALPENAAVPHGSDSAQQPFNYDRKSLGSTIIEGASASFGLATAAASSRPADPRPVSFTVQVFPARSPGTGPQADPPSPGSAESETLRLQGYRNYSLQLIVPARELKLAQFPGQKSYSARLMITAVSYVAGHAADIDSVQVASNFDTPTDPRISIGAMTAKLSVQMPEHGNRLLHITVEDFNSGQFGRLDIPVDKIVVPGE